MSDQLNSGGDLRPRPDPTTLTTAQLREAIAALKELVIEKFLGVQALVEERFTRLDKQGEQAERLRIEQKMDSAKANEAALTAIKEANEKTESSITQQLAQMTVSHKSDVDGLRRDIDSVKERIDDLRTRIVAVENQKLGAKEDRSGLYATLAIAGTVIVVALAIFGFFASRGGP